MKQTRFGWIMTLAALAAFATLPRAGGAQEHPEHPTAEKPKESLTMEKLAEAIQGYVSDDTLVKGGYFLVYDPVAKSPLLLTLDHVHQDRLSALGDGVYFACADFKSQDGKTYDLDVFMKEGETGLQTTDVMIHKVDGKPRYTWKQDGDLWVRETVK